jgi:hypothetical protein
MAEAGELSPRCERGESAEATTGRVLEIDTLDRLLGAKAEDLLDARLEDAGPLQHRSKSL